MELQFKREYISKKQYAVGELQALLGYALEIVDPRAKLAEGKLEPGESCMLLFGITPQEYAWKDADIAKLDHLAEQLRKNVPADRLIACQIRNILGKNVPRSVKPLTGESIDGGEFARRMAEKTIGKAGPIDAALIECRRLQNLCANRETPEGVKLDFAAAKRELCAQLRRLDTLYVAYDALMKGEWPSIGYDLRVELFTTRARAENMQRRIREVGGGMDKWKIREIASGEIEALFLKLAGNGVSALRIDNGFVAAEISVADLCSGTVPLNADLRLKLIAQVQFALRWKYLKEHNADEKLLRTALENMLTLRNIGEWQIGNSLLYAVCMEKNTSAAQLCTESAAKKLGNIDKKITPAAKTVMLNEPGGKKRFLAVFTAPLRAAALCERLHEDVTPVAMSFDDIAARANAADGIIIDPESLSYRIAREEFDRIRELREKAPQAVRIMPENKPENAPHDSVPNADAGDLPDPDAQSLSVLKEISEAQSSPENAKEVAQTAETDVPAKKKRGFFGKFFGK